jgi:hypothetical protein
VRFGLHEVHRKPKPIAAHTLSGCLLARMAQRRTLVCC